MCVIHITKRLRGKRKARTKAISSRSTCPRTPAHGSAHYLNDPRASGLSDDELVELGMNTVEGDPRKKEEFGGWF